MRNDGFACGGRGFGRSIGELEAAVGGGSCGDEARTLCDSADLWLADVAEPWWQAVHFGQPGHGVPLSSTVQA